MVLTPAERDAFDLHANAGLSDLTLLEEITPEVCGRRALRKASGRKPKGGEGGRLAVRLGWKEGRKASSTWIFQASPTHPPRPCRRPTPPPRGLVWGTSLRHDHSDCCSEDTRVGGFHGWAGVEWNRKRGVAQRRKACGWLNTSTTK